MRVPTRAKRPAFTRTYSLWKGDIFPFDRLTGYKKSNQNQIGRVLRFAFALKCIRIYLLFSPLSDFDSFCWRVHLSYGVSELRARVQLKTLSSLLERIFGQPPCQRSEPHERSRKLKHIGFLTHGAFRTFQVAGGVSHVFYQSTV